MDPQRGDVQPRQTWTRPSVAPLTDSGSRSDTPDVAARNGAPITGEPTPATIL
jgi:hypothetical protein